MLPAIALCGLLTSLSCSEVPSEAVLAMLREEAREANASALSAYSDANEDDDTRILRVSGEAIPTVLTWETLDKLSTSRIRTKNTQHPTDRTRIFEYRGILVRDLLDRVKASHAAVEVTFVSADGFRSTIRVADARKYDILLAVEADGKQMARAEGGPIYLVFPHSEAPDTQALYPDRFWAFYVTHVVVGNERPHLRIAGRVIDSALLSSWPEVSMRDVVGWKVQWPSTPVRIRGVRMADAIRAVGHTPSPDSLVTLRGKSFVHRSRYRPRTLTFGDLEHCGIMLATHWGDDDAPIPARLGGPLASAVPSACASTFGEEYWVPFLEEVSIEASQ